MEYLEIPYEEKLYDCKAREDGTWDRSDWADEKYKLGLDFPNLPYLIDEETGVKLVQTDASTRSFINNAFYSSMDYSSIVVYL